MLIDLSRARLVVIWCMSVLTIAALGIAAGVDLTTFNGELLLFTCFVPPAIMMLMPRFDHRGSDAKNRRLSLD